MVKLRVIGTAVVIAAAALAGADPGLVPEPYRTIGLIVVAVGGALGIPAVKPLTKRAFVADHDDPVQAAQEAVNGAAHS